MSEYKKIVEDLLQKAVDGTSTEALQFSQAALNAANAAKAAKAAGLDGYVDSKTGRPGGGGNLEDIGGFI